ncbi:LLM class flavin-dependent oxidoreductase [Actinophytocola xanthii]|uniref:5,10-methylene tetrahydromethanopterin reductase n=1 Tax=Actinophytocola xanthii TaxID=1912961 RepID=A0A1Q8CJT7_9PSEU|nr:LLM class flavin-dependent oxidoreductase [Actinophytocola xanthii]OLF14625.1 5,10-methylene tetrahydromethanopterin reductase [Actinophytocola xanthii]
MTTYSVLVPFAHCRPERTLPFAAFVQWSRALRLWLAQGDGGDPHQTVAFAAASGFRVPVGTGVRLMPHRHPFTAAQETQALAVAAGHPVVAGFGPGASVLQQALLGAPYASPLGAAREYLTVVRGLLAGEEVEHRGEYYTCLARLPSVPSPPVEVGLGVLRPAMARLAGEVADVAVSWLTPAAYLREVVVPALRAGAEARARPVPRLVAVVSTALERSGRDVGELVLAAHTHHLRMPHYADMLRRAGVAVDRADLTAAAEAVVKGGAFLSGTAGHLAEQLAEFRDAGVDEVVLNVSGVYAAAGGRAALEELDELLREAVP